MSRWELVKLGDVCDVNPPKKLILKQLENKAVSFIPMASVTENGNINLGDIRDYSDVSKGFSYFKENDILFAKITPCMENGKGAIAKGLHNGLGVGSTEFHVLRANDNLITSDWIYRYLSYSRIRKNAEKNMTGSAGQKRVPKAFLENLMIPLPPLGVQIHASEIFKRTQEIIQGHISQLDNLDHLINAFFYEMFGDPVINENGWGIRKLKDLSVLITKGSSPSWQGINYTDDPSQVLFVTSENVREGYLSIEKPKYLESKFNEIQKRSVLHYGDLLINIVGASIGRAAIYNLNHEANINQAVALVRCQNGINLNYICHYLNSPKALSMYKEMQVDVARANLSLKNIGDLEILNPPIELQNKFAEIVSKIEEQKSTVKKSLEESQNLFNSLMSKYFD